MPLADGTRLGVSAILAPLGKGEGKGSGLVYRDTLARLSSQGRAEPTPRSCRACLPGSVQRRSRGTRESSLELVRYVVLNPVRARMYRQPRDHRWSSYSETAGLRGAADWLDVNWTLSQFGVQTSRARRRFREFVAEGRGVNYRPWAELSGQIYLGSVEFQERMTKSIAGAKPGAEIPARQRRPARPDLATVEREVLCAFGASPSVLEGRSRHPARKAFALLARRVADAPLGAISSRMKLSSRPSGTTVRSAAEFEQKDRRFRRLVAEVEKRLR